MTALLRPAVDAEKRARDVLTYSEWGGKLSMPQYLEREHLLREHLFSKLGMNTWLLVEDDRVLTSCETFRNDSTVGKAAGITYSVATVFTEPELRGKGHAAMLMQQLVDRLKKDRAAQATVLYSDVGAPIYEKSGYRAFPAFDWVLPPVPFATGFEWMETAAAPPSTVGVAGQLALHPSAAQLDWHFERSRLYARFLNRTRLQHQGARAGDAAAWWHAGYKADELVVLWLEAKDAKAAGPVLAAAQAQAHHAGLKRVRLWETISLEGLPGAQRVARDGELPMVASLGAAITDWVRIERALWV